MHKVLVCLGSNTYSKLNIDQAKRMLAYYFPNIVFTKSLITVPTGERYVFPFRNVLGFFSSELTVEEIMPKLKVIEGALGRTARDKEAGRVVIDIDLLGFDDAILRPIDFERDYVQKLLSLF